MTYARCNRFYVQFYNAVPSEMSEFLISSIIYNYVTQNAIYEDFVQRKTPAIHESPDPAKSEWRKIVMRTVWKIPGNPLAFAIDRANTYTLGDGLDGGNKRNVRPNEINEDSNEESHRQRETIVKMAEGTKTRAGRRVSRSRVRFFHGSTATLPKFSM